MGIGLSGKSIPSKRSVRAVSGEQQEGPEYRTKFMNGTETERGDCVGTRTEGLVDLCKGSSLSEPEVSRREAASSKPSTPHPHPSSTTPLAKERTSFWLERWPSESREIHRKPAECRQDDTGFEGWHNVPQQIIPF